MGEAFREIEEHFRMSLLKDVTTENNGQWFCPIRIFGCLAALVFLFLEIWQVCIKQHDFDMMVFAGAFASIIAAFAAAITGKGRFIEGNPPEMNNGK